MRRLFLLMVPLALVVGVVLGVIGAAAFQVDVRPHTAAASPSASAGTSAPAVANNYLRGILQDSGVANPTFQTVAKPIVGSKGSTVYLYRVQGTGSDGHPEEAFVGVTVYNGQAANSVVLSKTQTDLSGMVTVQ